MCDDTSETVFDFDAIHLVRESTSTLDCEETQILQNKESRSRDAVCSTSANITTLNIAEDNVSHGQIVTSTTPPSAESMPKDRSQKIKSSLSNRVQDKSESSRRHHRKNVVSGYSDRSQPVPSYISKRKSKHKSQQEHQVPQSSIVTVTKKEEPTLKEEKDDCGSTTAPTSAGDLNQTESCSLVKNNNSSEQQRTDTATSLPMAITPLSIQTSFNNKNMGSASQSSVTKSSSSYNSFHSTDSPLSSSSKFPSPPWSTSSSVESRLVKPEPVIIRGTGNITVFGINNKYDGESFPQPLQSKLAPEEFRSTVNRINKVLHKHVNISVKWLLCGLFFCCCSCGCSMWPVICVSKRTRMVIEKVLEWENENLYHQMGLHWSFVQKKCHASLLIEYVIQVDQLPTFRIHKPD